MNFTADKWKILAALTVMVVALTFVFPSSFYYRVAALIWISAFTVIGLNLLMGYAGQVSLGHAGFFGIGAYAVAIGPVHLGIPPLLSLIIGVLLAGALAFLIGRPVLKLKGHYLAVATLGVGILISMVINNEAQWTGGPDGMNVEALGIKSLLKSMGWKVKTAKLWYWITGIVMICGAWVALNIIDSPTGRALRAIHDSEVAAKVAGIDVPNYKLLAFVGSAMYASIAGAMLAFMNRFITPDAAGFLHSIELVTMVVLGGMGSILGSVVGAAFLIILPQVLADLQHYEHMMLGLIMMIFMIFLRSGIVPSIANKLKGRAA
ncbi:branched-chain amino acid ABC transporter permease [Cohaesibacter gelatinilyticus]|uniref:Amino acid/amide ABC transporter membrane protein 2, HAAT family n=1 Tax=Cohaesibacter gelatinilyticus TaxID=372072 RepID=A0A285NCY2_9HYPH|nr:branched-chain amino acid ABC transporter permease [Cohaesibacter gelatinilyticus]SNZ07310.1 amino acid/amide ABC transporter membrane protein 2, HAAT family [Cohaesibacter gelatinilyticus]